jgi:hypothetical protein
MVGTLQIPAAGNYTFAVTAEDDFIRGIGGKPLGNRVCGPGPKMTPSSFTDSGRARKRFINT